MYHGANHDFVYSWGDAVTAFLAVSPSLVDFLVRIGKVEPWKIEVVPNGIDDAIFDLPVKSLDEKLSDGVGRIVMASRLAHDKSAQFPIAKQVLSACAKALPDVRWRLEVLGDGPLRTSFESDLRRFARANEGIDIAFEGWVHPDEIAQRMNDAVVGLVTGRGAITTLAAGALCVGVGARGSVGLQVGGNLRAGLWSNFGDHACPQFTPTPLDEDLRTHLVPEAYAEALEIGRRAMRRSRASSVVDGSLLSALQCG
jgi:glycosyltransferase involved in cell wall biosynthesis